MNYFEFDYEHSFSPYNIDSTSTLKPEEDVVYIWKASYRELLKTSIFLEEMLSGDELSRALSYANAQRRKYYTAGRVFLRTVLAEHTGIEPARLIFGYSKSGKPFLDQSQNRQKLYFNLTHSKELLLIAVAYSRDIGLDLEYIRPVFQLEMIAKRFFPVTEQNQIALVSPGKRDALFMKLWVRREAYLKLHGLGVATQITGKDNRAENTAPGADFIQTFRPAKNYIAALAIAGSTAPLLRGYVICPAGKTG